jgi:hypothetical protein
MKIGQLFDLATAEKLRKSGSKPGFTDAYAGLVLERNLTAIDPILFEKKYPELTFVNSGIEADNTGGYARRIQSLRLIEEGGFKTAGDNSTNKGKISLSAEDSFLSVIEREAETKWSQSEVKEAELQGINIVSRYLEATNKIYLREIDEIGLVGVDGKTGLLNYAGFTSTGASGLFSVATALNMYSDVSGLINAQWASVFNTPGYMADSVTMPVDVMNLLQSTILDSAASPDSVLLALQKNFPQVAFTSSFRATTDMVAYATSRDSMVMRVPQPLQYGEVIKTGSFTYQNESVYRVAGLDVLEDASGYVLTDVSA